MWSPVQGVLPSVCEVHSSRLILMGNKPEGLIRKADEVYILCGCVHLFIIRRVMYPSFMKFIKSSNLIWKHEEKAHIWRLQHKWILKKHCMIMWTGLNWLRIRSNKQINEPSDSMEGRELFCSMESVSQSVSYLVSWLVIHSKKWSIKRKEYLRLVINKLWSTWILCFPKREEKFLSRPYFCVFHISSHLLRSLLLCLIVK
jgi:hypothetical protein